MPLSFSVVVHRPMVMQLRPGSLDLAAHRLEVQMDSASSKVEVTALGPKGVQVGYGLAPSGGPANAAVSAAIRELGALEILFNNAGILDGYFDVDELDESAWRRVIDIDLTGVFLGCKRALAEMLPAGRGRIVNMASVAGLAGTGGGAAYIAAKHGVVGLTRQMAVTYAARGLRVNCICPGAIPTGLRAHSQSILGPGVPDMSGRGVAVNDEQVRALVPVGVRGTVEDIAEAVCWLVSDQAGYVNGHALVVDGGWRAK